MAAFAVEIPVRFQHTDPAGMVFYPRYFEMINQVVEDWFAEALGLDFRSLHGARSLGVPTVRVETDFLKPSRLGDRLVFALEVVELGRSSFTLAIAAHCAGEERLRATAVLATMDLAEARARPIPDDLRAAMGRFLAHPAVERAS